MKSYSTLSGFVTGSEPTDVQPRFANHATLRIFSEAGLDFDGLEATLGVKPTTAARKGERAGPRSPPNRGDVWMYRATIAEGSELAQHIDALWEKLRPHVPYLLALKTHATVSVHLGYSSNIDHAGLSIPSGSLEMFRALDVSFDLNIIVVVDS